MGELFKLLFVSICGGKRARSEISGALQANNRELRTLHAHHLASGICFDRMIAEWNEKMYPNYREQLNQQRVAMGLPHL